MNLIRENLKPPENFLENIFCNNQLQYYTLQSI